MGTKFATSRRRWRSIRSVERGKVLWLTVVVEGGLAVLAWGLGAAFGPPAYGDFRLDGRAVLLGVVASLPPLAGVALALRSEWPPLARLRDLIHRVIGQLFAELTVLDLAIVSILAGIGEEAFFRGFLQTALAGKLGITAAVAVTSLIFGLAHFVSFGYAVYATVVGAYLGVLMLAGGLVVPIVAHAVFDFVALTWLIHVRPVEIPDDRGDSSAESP